MQWLLRHFVQVQAIEQTFIFSKFCGNLEFIQKSFKPFTTFWKHLSKCLLWQAELEITFLE